MSTIEPKERYLSDFSKFENNLNGKKALPFYNIRRKAISKFSELGFPSTRDEEWKYTNLTPILNEEFSPQNENIDLDERDIKQFTFDGLEENTIVFINGVFSEKLSKFKPRSDRIIVSGISAAFIEHSDLIHKYIALYADYKLEPFVALNTAFTQDGAFIYVPSDVDVQEPIHLLNISIGENGNFISHPRNLFFVGKNSRIKIVETFNHIFGGKYFVNQVTEVIVEENASMEHVKIQDESTKAFHIANRQVSQNKNSNYSSINIDLGSELVRNNLNLKMNKENCEGHLIGFYLGKNEQHIDNHTLVDHAMPNCYSNELYKGILDDKAKGVFSGKIFVRKDAQKTNAYQDNKSLLLSDTATVNTKPQLEIFADDVKCSHGATVGELDDEALFYLRSRGIEKEKAQSILQYAFANDVFNYIQIEPVRKKLDEIIHERLLNKKG